MSSNYIVLRNCPKTELTIDMISIEIEGGFRGIKHLDPGIHHISVKNYEGESCGFWTMIDIEDEDNDTIVKVYDSTINSFIDDVPDNVEKYTRLAQSGQMDDDFVRYPYKKIYNWRHVTGSIRRLGKIPELYLNSGNTNKSISPFRHFIEVLHDEKLGSALAEFDFAFVRILITTLGEKDPDAFARWQEIIDIVYNATPEDIIEHNIMIINWISTYITQLQELPDSVFEVNNDSELGIVVISKVASFVENVVNAGIDSNNRELKLEGLSLAKYFTQRGYRV